MTYLADIEAMYNQYKQKSIILEQQVQGLNKQNEILMKENKSLKAEEEEKADEPEI